ncbi:MAG: tail fiber domain-containing protein [bacterium]|nr:tail fiber domain-containing protein [bacterium]
MKKHLVPFIVTAFLVFCMSWSPIHAGNCENSVFNPVAEAMIGSGGIYWQPQMSYAELHLAVSCPNGKVFSKIFRSGTTPYLGMSAPDGTSLINGSYTYELRLIPTTGKMLRGSADDSDAVRKQGRKAMTQTGYFTVQNGAMVVSRGGESTINDRDEGNVAEDQLIYDDLIVTGSICVGFDCANGESFGYCTLKLKENNLQLCFEDTSIGSFPTNDWKIQVNDTTSGGASYFTVWDTDGGRRPFTLEAGAPAHSLYVEDYGRVGLGTSIPYVELHIVDGDSPTVRLDQDGSSGWAAQRWDMCGNETNFFIRDVTNGSKLCFRIQPNTPSNTLCMRSTGNVGVGTWSPSQKFHVYSEEVNVGLFESTQSDCWFFLENSDSGDYNSVGIGAIGDALRLRSGDTERIRILASGYVGIGELNPAYPLDFGAQANGAHVTTGGVWVSSSSREYKENINTLSLDEAMETLKNLEPVKFNYKNEKDELYVGFIAEDVPELVATNDRQSMAPMDVTAVLTKVLKEQQLTVAKQQELLQTQQETIRLLTERLTQLEKKVK